jgi:signal transduction histidine kinase
MLCVVMLLGFVYWKTAREMTRRVDQILNIEKKDYTHANPGSLPVKISEGIRRDLRHTYLFGLFSKKGGWVAGNLSDIPSDLPQNGNIYQIKLSSSKAFPQSRIVRISAIRLSSGDLLLLGHDVQQLLEFREIMKGAFFWGGSLTVVIGLLFGFMLSFKPLSRIDEIQRVCELIMRGDIRQRLPISRRRDELDMLIVIVNKTLDEIERLMSEVKSVCDSIAHDLRTPLTRLRAMLYRAQQHGQGPIFEQMISEMDSLLLRFQALLRISEIENKERRAGFNVVQLSDILKQAVELFEPLAEDKLVKVVLSVEAVDMVKGDGHLLFEAIANIFDNAVKFTPSGGTITIRLTHVDGGARIDFIDTGPGIQPSERAMVLNRFYRGTGSRSTSGFGLGLSIVMAIVRLHDFEFVLGEWESQNCVSIICRSYTLHRFID